MFTLISLFALPTRSKLLFTCTKEVKNMVKHNMIQQITHGELVIPTQRTISSIDIGK
jgi:hypothetical protein